MHVTSAWQLDRPFGGGDGMATVDVNPLDEDVRVIVRPDGRLVVAGSTRAGSSEGLLAAGFLANGAPDGTFGLYGLTIVDNVPRPAAALAGGPGFIVAATAFLANSTGGGEHVIRTVGLKTNGVIEDSWGDHGVQNNGAGGDVISVTDAVVEPTRCGTNGTCTPARRLLVFATTHDAPHGMILGLNP